MGPNPNLPLNYHERLPIQAADRSIAQNHMITIAIFGAGGKMGLRVSQKLKQHTCQPFYVEIDPKGRDRLAQLGLEVTPAAEAASKADAVILAVPDRSLGQVAKLVVPLLRPGALVITLDPAAAMANQLPLRHDLGFFITHPCHPPVFRTELHPDASRDFFGGVAAPQPIVCALLQGTESHYQQGEMIARAVFSPISRVHRVTLDHMALLEPAMAETVASCCITIIREAMDEAIRQGVPADAARDFLLGHISIPLAAAFGEIDSPFSEGARLMIEFGKRKLFRADWKRVFEPESVREQVKCIVDGQLPQHLLNEP
jgi:D-apionate oxidoisomerase